jgi:hypothetical protein
MQIGVILKHKNTYDAGGIYDNLLETKDYKVILSKSDDELFDEEKHIVEKSFRVKRISYGKNEKWRIYEDNKIMLTIDGTKISKKEREYLRTTEGFSFIIKQVRSGIKSINKLRVALKENI